MKRSILVAGIGNIFQGDDAFGCHVVQHLCGSGLPDDVRLMDAGIRSLDLCFALLDGYEAVILVDATARGGQPGTLYTIEIGPEDIPDVNEHPLVNSHGLDPVRVLSLAKSMGARFRNTYLVGCEPAVLDRDDTGELGLSEIVAAAVELAAAMVRKLINEIETKSIDFEKEEVSL